MTIEDVCLLGLAIVCGIAGIYVFRKVFPHV